MSVLGAVCADVGVMLVPYANWAANERRESECLVADVNAEWEHRLDIGALRGFHVIRDPRDIVVSAYFSHRYSHPSGPWLDRHRDLLQRLAFEDGIRASIDFREQQFRRMCSWNYQDPDIHETTYERLVADPMPTLREICAFLSLYPDRIGEGRLEQILTFYSFENLTGGRARGEEDRHHHYRKGTPGDWRDCFSEANKQHFKAKYRDLLLKLGYEKDDAW